MHEASIRVYGDVDLCEVIAVVEQVTGANQAGRDLLVDSSAIRRSNYYTLLFYGGYIDDALLLAARALHQKFPQLELVARDEVGNIVDWVSADTKTPFTYPKIHSESERQTLAIDIPADVVARAELKATRNGNSLSEELSKWIVERALSAS